MSIPDGAEYWHDVKGGGASISGQPYAGPKQVPAWPKCPIHNVEGHMADTVACKQMTADLKAKADAAVVTTRAAEFVLDSIPAEDA